MSNESKTSLDYTNAITSAHNEAEQAFNVINANSLLPANFGKFELSYIDGPSGCKLISQIDYYSKGCYEKTRIVAGGDQLGTAHKTTINLINATPPSVAGKGFIVYDDIGPVLVWYNVDFANTTPLDTGAYRDVAVNILSSHNSQTIANKTALALSMDPKFLGVYTLSYVIVSSSSVGIKPDSYDVNLGIFIKNSAGSEPVSLNNRYFYINSNNDLNKYYVWYNVNGAGVDPNISGRTGLMVPILGGSSPNTVAQATRTILNTTNKFITNIDNDSLFIRNKFIGVTTSATSETSNFLVVIEKSGEDREHLATVVLGYDASNTIVSVERL